MESSNRPVSEEKEQGIALAQVRIRPMVENDLDTVHLIDRLSFTLPWPRSSFRYELCDNQAALLWVAEVEKADGEIQLCGAIVVWLILDEAHIATLAVHPDFRQFGIGRLLLATALAEAIRRGVCLATLEVRANNVPAQKLYRRFGFVEVGRRKSYYQDNHEDALLLTVDDLDERYLAWLDSGLALKSFHDLNDAPDTLPLG